jgi:hypothetical protein
MRPSLAAKPPDSRAGDEDIYLGDFTKIVVLVGRIRRQRHNNCVVVDQGQQHRQRYDVEIADQRHHVSLTDIA